MPASRPHGLPVVHLDELVAAAGLPTGSVQHARDVQVAGITVDSSAVVPGDLFAALAGEHHHGAEFILAALAGGAVAVLTDEAGAEIARGAAVSVPVLVVDAPRELVGPLAARIYARPSSKMALVGVTGTNGKTTTVYLVEAAFAAAGHTTALLGTVETRIAGEHLAQTRTTPEAPELQAILAVALERGVDAAAMEVSSHALALGRVGGTVFKAAVFTNLSQDHLDFHHDLSAYFNTKASMFRPGIAETAVICVDDEYGEQLMERVRLPHVTYSTSGVAWADWQARDVVASVEGSTFTALGPAGESVAMTVPIPGLFNVANAMGALAAAVVCGVDPDTAAAGIGSVTAIPGRLQRIDVGQEFTAFVDYAHTPQAVRRLLETLRTVTSGRLVVVLGCGGDRDRDKRGPMAYAAAELADRAIFTTDNARSEDPADILRQMTEGLDLRHEVEPDRRDAIAAAVSGLTAGDTVVVAGKGHETFQEIAGITSPFDDRDVLSSVIRERLAVDGSTTR